MRASRADVERRKIESYFHEHQISEKMNTMLNEMVQVRPTAPYSWLARRMRLDDSGHMPAVGTVPLLAKAAADGLGSELQKQWAFCLGLQGIATPALSQSAGGASAVQLTIESDGPGVLLAIRPDK